MHYSPAAIHYSLSMAIVYLGIGSNVGRVFANLEEAHNRLQRVSLVEILSRSEVYCTRPESGPPQRDYLNGVLKIGTRLDPEQLLGEIKEIERGMGRVPSGRNFPRIIDIDILLYDNCVRTTEGLMIPHPRMHERYFVLRGLSEIAPDVIHPTLGKTISELYRELDRKDRYH